MSEPERSEASEVSVAQRAGGSAECGGAEARVTSPRPHTACSMCRQAIPSETARYRCSVSACNAGRMKLRFCSVSCFERHIPTARHRKADCVEE